MKAYYGDTSHENARSLLLYVFGTNRPPARAEAGSGTACSLALTAVATRTAFAVLSSPILSSLVHSLAPAGCMPFTCFLRRSHCFTASVYTRSLYIFCGEYPPHHRQASSTRLTTVRARHKNPQIVFTINFCGKLRCLSNGCMQ